MTIKVGSNIASLLAQRQLQKSSNTLSTLYERLSTGMRINKASDDAASLALSSSLNNDSRLFAQAMRNTSDGVSLLNIAEGALTELTGIVTRITELAEQAANGVYSTQQREVLDLEAQALRGEFNRIAQSTSFNGINILSGEAGTITLQVGKDGTANSVLSLENFGLGRAVSDGTFGTAAITPITGRPIRIRTGDFDNDGYDDIFSIGDSSGDLHIALSNGDGTFQVTELSPLTGTALSDAEDIDNDGDLDFVVVNALGLRAFLGNGNGTFSQSAIGVANNETDAILSDLNNDGNLDLITAKNSTNEFTVYMGLGSGTFGGATTYTTAAGLTATRVLDINEDGVEDVVSFLGASTEYRLGTGSGTFSSVNSFATGGLFKDMADFDSDGVEDIMISSGSFSLIRYGNGNGTFAAGITVLSTASLSQDAIDINEDGFDDIVFSDQAGTLRVSLNNGDGTFGTATTLSVVSDSIYSVDGDFNGDGAKDIATATFANAEYAVWLSNTTSSATLDNISLTEIVDARDALTSLSETLDSLNLITARVGAYQSRLNSIFNNLASSRDAYLGAAARITDVDIAETVSEMVRQQILQQVGTAILSQANLQPGLVLNLLRQNEY